ncbi:MAG: LytTR family DNA-binding domain-containing protein [Saprospiraceae bacterium]|nr:LytTR family DNA-binding domain-containing protein [Saprospiraceae bacterium]
MHKLRTIIVDDEPKSLEVLEHMVQEYLPHIHLVKTFTSPVEALGYLRMHTVDLVFLDIQMPEMDGFEMLDHLSEIDFDLIFTTAHNDYAIKAFRYYAIAYLLKPVEVEDLQQAMELVGKKHRHRYRKPDLIRILREIEAGKDATTRLAVPTQEGVEFVQINHITRLQADGNYTYIYLKDGDRIYTSKTLKYFEQLLPGNKFYRSHQSHIINISAMKRYVKADGGYIEMHDGAIVAISRSKRQEFVRRFYS